MEGLYLDTFKLGHILMIAYVCSSMVSTLNEIAMQNMCQHYLTNNDFGRKIENITTTKQKANRI